MTTVFSRLTSVFSRQSFIGFTSVTRQLNTAPPIAVGEQVVKQHAVNEEVQEEDGQSLPVWSCNEWDPLKEIIVGRAEGQRVPFLSPDLQVGWKQVFSLHILLIKYYMYM